MRAYEFMREARDFKGGKGMKSDQSGAIPNSHVYPELDNSSGYMAYRFGIALAGMPDQKMDVAGPTGLKLVSIGYTPADEEILQAAADLIGTPRVRLTPNGSTESPGTNSASPVPDRKKLKK